MITMMVMMMMMIMMMMIMMMMIMMMTMVISAIRYIVLQTLTLFLISRVVDTIGSSISL